MTSSPPAAPGYLQQEWQDNNPAYPVSALREKHIEAGLSAQEAFTRAVEEYVLLTRTAVSVRAFGAEGAGRRLTGVTCSSGSANVTVAGANFTSADVGKYACVFNESLQYGTVTKIEKVTGATTIVLETTAGLTLAGGATSYIQYGPGESAAIEEALEATVAQGFTATAEYNQPKGLGQGLCIFPATKEGGCYFLDKPLTIPAAVIPDCFGQLVNVIPSRTAPAVTFAPYTGFRRFQMQCLGGGGVQLGEAGQAGGNAHIDGEGMEVWGSGTAEGCEALKLVGAGFTIDKCWLKSSGGSLAFNGAAASDCTINRIHAVGFARAGQLANTNQFKAFFVVDTCGRAKAEIEAGKPEVDGISIDKECSDSHITVQAFASSGVNAPRKMTAIVAVGRKKEGAGKMQGTRVDIINGQLTGGVGIFLSNCEDLEYNVHVTNRKTPSSLSPTSENEITAAVQFGENVNSTVRGTGSGTGGANEIRPVLGEVGGTLDYTYKGTLFKFQKKITTITMAGQAAAGSGATVEVVNNEGNDQSGRIKIKTGTGTTAGEQVKVTFKIGETVASVYNTGTNPRVPIVHLEEENTRTAKALPCVVSPAVTGFGVSFAEKPEESAEYVLTYAVVG